MKKHISLFTFILFSYSLFAQNLTGDWYAKLNLGAGSLPIVFHVHSPKKNKYEVTLDSPSQKAYGMTASKVKIKKGKIDIEINSIGASFSGQLVDSAIEGTFQQMGRSFPLVLSRDSSVIAPPKRPQTPQKPYPYLEKEVTFTNSVDNIQLAGTFTYPEEGSNFKAVVLVTGSGPQDRNEEMLYHQPFLIISDYLTRNGIAVLRYDDRGVGQSKGVFSTSDIYNFRNDAQAAVDFLKKQTNVNPNQIGVIGHSEGSMIAQMLAAKPNNIDFAVFLAGPGVPLKELMIQQLTDIMISQGESQGSIDSSRALMTELYGIAADSTQKCDGSCYMDIIKKNISPEDLQKEMMQYIGLTTQLDAKWFKSFIRFHPSDYLTKIQIPIFALNGDKDIQVKGEDNLQAIEKGLQEAKNTNFKVKIYPNLNHLFQICNTCTLEEYEKIEMTFSEEALNDMVNWINNLK